MEFLRGADCGEPFVYEPDLCGDFCFGEERGQLTGKPVSVLSGRGPVAFEVNRISDVNTYRVALYDFVDNLMQIAQVFRVALQGRDRAGQNASRVGRGQPYPGSTDVDSKANTSYGFVMLFLCH